MSRAASSAPSRDDALPPRQPGPPCLRLELTLSTVRRLMESGLLCPADFRCQDADTRRLIRELCLECCARRLPDGIAVTAHPDAARPSGATEPAVPLPEQAAGLEFALDRALGGG